MPEMPSLEGMNEAQRQAVLHGEGPVLLLAGPGSGKTFTITNRILCLLERGVPPESILVITFMKEAALSMQERFGKICASPVPSPVNFGTFHSVFYHILKESHALHSGHILKTSEKKNLLLPILKTYEKKADFQKSGGGSWEELGEEALELLSAISYYKNTVRLSEAAGKAPGRWQQDFADICREYQRAVRKAGGIDFDDMLYDCRRLLAENREVREYWQKRFSHILIDEFQDVNPVQYQAVKLLASRPYNIFAVGDDDQSIYGFRGSEPACLKRFAEEFHARRLLLDVNYRSAPEIVRASLDVIGENKDRFAKALRAAGKGGPEEKVSLHTFEGAEEQYGYLLQVLSAGCQGADSCAVLFRTNSYMQGLAARLKAADIPYVMRERAASIYEHFIVKDICAYLQTAQGQGTREQMLRIMNRPSRYISREALGEGRGDINGMIRYYEEALLPRRQKENVLEALYYFERQLRRIGTLSLLPAVNYVLKAAGYEQYLRQQSGGKPEKWAQWQELLEWLKADAAKQKDLKSWLIFQKEYAEALENGQSVGDGRPGEGGRSAGGRQDGQSLDAAQRGRTPIQLLTVHGAKGLEFDRVWIPDCNERIFPYGRMPDEKSVEEERRIFYVAMTRAKKSLELLCLTGTKERPRLPSRFLKTIWTDQSISSSNSQSSRYSSKASDTFSYSSSSSM